MSYLNKKYFIALCIFALASLMATGVAQAQPKNESLAGQIQRVKGLIGSQQLVKARPLLRSLRNNPQVQANMHATLDFHIALSYVFEYYDSNASGALDEALKTFDAFIKAYPKHSLTSMARYNVGDIQAVSKKFKEALQSYIPLYKDPVPGIPRKEVLKKIIMIYILEDKWVAGAPYFEAGMRLAESNEDRTTYAAYLLIAKAKQGDVSDSREFLDFFSSPAPVFYTPRFNASLMEIGDQLKNDGDLATASLFYQFVRSYEILEVGLERYVRRLGRQLEQYKDNPVLRNFYQQTLTELENAKADLAALRASTNYTPLLNWRIASVYMDMGRDWEAFWRFRVMVDSYPNHEFAEDILFSSFSLGRKLGESEEAESLAESYLGNTKFTRYRGTVSDEISTDYLALEKYDKLYELTRWFLEIDANDPAGSLLLFKYGMARLTRFETRELISDFQEFRKKYGSTNSSLVINYFLGLGLLSEEYHQEALDRFEEVIANPNTRFRADASFRKALCVMGLDRLVEARDLLMEFVSKYPDNGLRAQAELILGNLAHLLGDSAAALSHYYLIVQYTDDRELLASGEIKIAGIYLEMRKEAEAVERLSKFYDENFDYPRAIIPIIVMLSDIYTDSEQPRVALDLVKRPLTTYYDLMDVDKLDGLLVNYLRKDRELREMRIETEAFLETVSESPDLLKELIADRGKQYRFFKENKKIDALVQYSFVKDNEFRNEIRDHFKAFDDAHDELVESILAANPEATVPEKKPYPVVELDALENLSAEIDELNEMIPEETADSWLNSELAKAQQSGNIPLLVRIQAVFAALEKPEGIPEANVVELVGDEELWPQVGIAGKLWILKEYAKSNPVEVIRYLEESKTEYMNTDTELGVHGLLAECYQQEGRTRDAIEAYKTLIKRFGSADEAGDAAIKIGRLEIQEGNYQAAREDLEMILHRNEWRGQRHGDALLWIGRAYVEEGKLPEAHGFFERIMLGYPGFNELLATAYYEDVKVLKSMGEMESAKTVFEAFKMTPGLDETETADLIRKEFE